MIVNATSTFGPFLPVYVSIPDEFYQVHKEVNDYFCCIKAYKGASNIIHSREIKMLRLERLNKLSMCISRAANLVEIQACNV